MAKHMSLRYYSNPKLTVYRSLKSQHHQTIITYFTPSVSKVHFTINVQVMKTRVKRVNELRSLRTAPSVCVAHAHPLTPPPNPKQSALTWRR